ncbi:uncharacterized protein [Solanum lycopersicum]|uniref:uncharacterized protein n=1 Tax=Solanum lycopersicum TaxID=4081 RepID=UPI00374A4155
MREAKVVEFINLRLGGMSVHEYCLKFTKLSKYAPSFVSNPRDGMSRFMTGVSDDLQEKFHSAMLHDNMNISRLMGHSTHVEESRSRRKSNDSKRERSFDGGSSKNRLEIQDNPRFKKRVSSLVPSKFQKSSGDRVSNPKPRSGMVLIHQLRSQLEKSVARNTMGIALRGRIFAMVVVKVGIRLGISQI